MTPDAIRRARDLLRDWSLAGFVVERNADGPEILIGHDRGDYHPCDAVLVRHAAEAHAAEIDEIMAGDLHPEWIETDRALITEAIDTVLERPYAVAFEPVQIFKAPAMSGACDPWAYQVRVKKRDLTASILIERWTLHHDEQHTPASMTLEIIAGHIREEMGL